jgi:putative intracellular protease/amidase
MSPTRILMIATSAAKLDNGEPTGVWLEELTTPYYAFRDSGADVVLASIAGGPIPVDPRSLQAEGETEASVTRYRGDDEAQALVAATPRFDGFDDDAFDAVFLPGGHGTMVDYPRSKELASLVARRLADGRLLAAVCHGPAALVAAVKPDGTPAVAGRRLAAFTDSEERAVGLDRAVPFLLASRLTELGAHHEKGEDFAPFVLRDGSLITGQNPASAGPAAALVLKALQEAAQS